MIPFNIEANYNSEGLYPSELFTKQHKDLLEQAERWMKGTANSCIIVSIAIITGVLSTTFSLSGGINATLESPMT